MGFLKLLLLLCASTCLCQRDCTGVECPILNNCIEEILESGACCATCLQTGCKCEGYQYYDCVNAGFKSGQVPEGKSYFVDFGSTECSCPNGGGRISCHFIPCPEIPANCIEMSEPIDACSQCERLGCVHEGEKYEAGHSFHMDPCQVCHCPNDGGSLMCYPIPDCDQKKAHKPMPVTTVEKKTPWEHLKKTTRNLYHHPGSRSSLSQLSSVQHGDRFPFFHPTPSNMEEEEVEDYDYPITDSSETSLPDLASHRKPEIISVADLENIPPHRANPRNQELKVGVHEATTNKSWFPLTDGIPHNPRKDTSSNSEDGARGTQFNYDKNEERLSIYQGEMQSLDYNAATEQPSFTEGTLTTEDIHRESKPPSIFKESYEGEMYDSYEDTTYSETGTDSAMTVVTVMPPTTQETDLSTTFQATVYDLSLGTNRSILSEAREHHIPLTVEETPQKILDLLLTLINSTDTNDYNETSSIDDGHEQHSVMPGVINESIPPYDKVSLPPSIPHGEHETNVAITPAPDAYPTLTFNPTSRSPLTVKPEVGLSKQAQGLSEYTRETIEMEEEEKDNILSTFPKTQEGPVLGVVESCCEAGQNWASENQHCNNLPPGTDADSVCGVVQEQCCVGALKESRCLAGLIAAKAGEVCEVSTNHHCGEDTQKECCSCCALGLRLGQEGRGCDVHRHLSYPCGHIFLSCCENKDQEQSIPPLTSKERPTQTIQPERVADGQFSKQPFSIEDAERASNSVEKLDIDECEKYKEQLCHHTCVNTPSSYRCECHPGYILMQDGIMCSRENLEEDNRVTEDEGPFTPATPLQETSQISPIQTPCTGNGLCSQHCSVVKGQARCSCFPGFSLKPDGQTCEDENECVTNTHTCLANERCVNTVGAFVCERQISCQSGYQPRNGVCEDIDECVVRSHNCETGFQCQNTLGSFHCSPKQQHCLTGFSQDPHGNCVDIDECSVVREPCTSGFNCINTVGSYTCQRRMLSCGRGYHSSTDGTRCVDVDECTTGTHRCTEAQVCHNLPGRHRCECQMGYQYDATRRVCVDVNECWRYPGRLCAQTCENTVGSYQCSCTTGFSLAFDGKNCEDINECNDNNPCSQECANTYGSYQCYCRVGYYLKEDGHTCEDIDECSQSIGNMCAFRCVNVQGSYQCACPPQGYSMSPNGHSCQDIDECVTGTHNCSATQTCYNIQGGFRCLSFTCPENYKKVSDTRCERVNCFGTQDCKNTPIRITYYQLSFQTNIVIPAQIFRIAPSPAYAGDNIIIGILRGNEEGFFSTRRLNSFTGAVYLHRELPGPRDFLIDVEMKLLRQGTISSFLARIYVFITAHSI